MSARTVSVVIPTLNRVDLLPATLRSVLAQRGVEIEVIVVDDGSVDDVATSVPETRDPRVRVFRHERSMGVSAARNTGIAAATGQWIAFVDDDDLWAPDKLPAQLDTLSQAPRCQWSCVGVVIIDGRRRIIGCHRTPGSGDVSRAMLARQVVPGGGSGVLVHRDLLAVTGGFDPGLTLNEDWDLYLRLAQRSPLAAVDRPLLAYSVHAANRSLDVETSDREFEIVRSRYADLRTNLAVEIDGREWDRWKSMTYLRAGRPGAAVNTAIGARRRPQGLRDLAATLVLATVPGSVRACDLRAGWRVPASWRSEARAWLRTAG